MRIAIDLPDVAAIQKTNQQYFKEALVAMLYQVGDVSSKEGSAMLNMPRREFEEMLARFEVSIMPDDDQSIAIELGI